MQFSVLEFFERARTRVEGGQRWGQAVFNTAAELDTPLANSIEQDCFNNDDLADQFFLSFFHQYTEKHGWTQPVRRSLP